MILNKAVQMPKISQMPQYTGQGFKGEKALAIASIVLTIVSTLLLIDLTLKQREHLKKEIQKSKK